ncbi:hypothetical protein [Actinomyces sp. zg296]|uniref:hypothetical protein n=1 Tax=Actinomyces sp. zg296 TaxID=2609289 RepID=UPI001357D013|nr:hypothetical protein [Actinomyces sp. zg296]
MPRIATIITPDVPDITLILGVAMARFEHATIRREEDGSAVMLFDDADAFTPALHVPRPFVVSDPREVLRLHDVVLPPEWRPVILTVCAVGTGELFDPYLDIVQDAAIMSGGIVSLNGRQMPPPKDWPWHRGADGRWEPDPDLPGARR